MIEAVPPLSGLLELAVRAAHLVSPEILAVFVNSSQQIERKPDGSVVTQADKNAEARIRALFAESAGLRYPVLGEELGDDTVGSRYRWTVDPIDGTLSYSRGIPNFGTLIAFEDAAAAHALVGVIHLPAFGETYAAARGSGASCNGNAIRVAPPRPLDDCLVAVSNLRAFQTAQLEEGYARLSQAVPQLRGISDCWSHAMAARGALDVVVEFGLNRWDIAATEVIIEEAGGACLVRPSRVTRKFDAVLGNAQAVDAVARIIGF